MSASTNHNPNSTPAQFRRKLGTYMTGVAIGFMFLGMVYYFKWQSQQRELDAQRAAQQQETGGEQTGASP